MLVNKTSTCTYLLAIKALKSRLLPIANFCIMRLDEIVVGELKVRGLTEGGELHRLSRECDQDRNAGEDG